MAKLILNLKVLRSQAQLKGWSNRPQVPLITRWQQKTKPKTAASAAAAARNLKATATTRPWATTTTNVLLLHPICRCCTDVVKSVRRPSKRLVSKVTSPGSAGRKPTWDGLPSTHYMRLWPVSDEDKLRQARITAASGFQPINSPEQIKPTTNKRKKRSWKFWQSLF
ncbi:hypothetical protein MPTK1_6g02380 [Marchantia polymorpha subsp. ruderalis]|uniref:Uncharacterized protein n=2 Tax=Marchantia polymorpha TaxID=3197 RepID=A0AAF6BMQ5_MARPO|nr:hypothetical protein MARPO_0035s0023 [Marchantia polymorpha]BBN13289.1 hypothetical protein Mp_6g02380 [Marchantia polymorpha subsp. ruderalis]|eukprot:PTQ41215.1 hypothetical protein MARPO_0035s0023 [Marchantia polymorpha]